ncbi:MAG: cytochrome c [Gemmatimonadetes bacterium]|nr:cytochrome c [Gemmatimonadota bacterium]
MQEIYRAFRFALPAFFLVAAGASGQDDGRTTAHGVYSEAQATRGEDVYWNVCSECHVEDDFAGPFMQSWSGASIKDLFEEIRGTMPEDNPGGLPEAQYVDVVAYMFKLNGMPTGDADLTSEALDEIEVDWRASYDDVDAGGDAPESSADTTSTGANGDDPAGDAVTTAHGVYSDDQAARGEEVFWNVCSECHVEDDFAGPFMQSWSGASVEDLFEEIRATMPEDNPGGMPASRYIDVISYMFKLNGMPTGDVEMTEDGIDGIDIDWRPSYDDPATDER